MADDDRYDLRVLVMDDSQRWRQILNEGLEQLGGTIKIDFAETYAEAKQAITNHAYDLVTVDLALGGDVDDPRQADQQGMDLLRDLRGSQHNRDGCGLIVVTGYPTPARVREALKIYAVDDFLEKLDFSELGFLKAARAAIRHARLRQARTRADSRYNLKLRLDNGRLLGSDYTGPEQQASYTAKRPIAFNQVALAQRGDQLNVLLLQTNGDPNVWRPQARLLGADLYKQIKRSQHIHGDLAAVRALADRFSDLTIQFCGPSECLGVPFELLRDSDDYLGLKYLLTRSLVMPEGSASRKTESFHRFVETLLAQNKSLRVLVVGANNDGQIPAAVKEARDLASAMRANLDRLGISHEITELIGADASLARVRSALSSGRYHLFHYAGHGRFNDTLPEIGGLVLRDGQLTASDLNLLVRDTEMRIAFLSCCLGARTDQQSGRGEFYGPLEALARADVPVVLGYRWVVADEPARELALRFYDNLWRSFSPGDALLQARKDATLGHHGRDNHTWAAPVLVAQNG